MRSTASGWHRKGSCSGSLVDSEESPRWLDRDVFFGEEEAASLPRAYLEAARRFCYGCLVRDTCLAYALHSDQEFGVWGGLSRPERERAVEHYDGIEDIIGAMTDGSLEGVVRRR